MFMWIPDCIILRGQQASRKYMHILNGLRGFTFSITSISGLASLIASSTSNCAIHTEIYSTNLSRRSVKYIRISLDKFNVIAHACILQLWFINCIIHWNLKFILYKYWLIIHKWTCVYIFFIIIIILAKPDLTYVVSITDTQYNSICNKAQSVYITNFFFPVPFNTKCFMKCTEILNSLCTKGQEPLFNCQYDVDIIDYRLFWGEKNIVSLMHGTSAVFDKGFMVVFRRPTFYQQQCHLQECHLQSISRHCLCYLWKSSDRCKTKSSGLQSKNPG